MVSFGILQTDSISHLICLHSWSAGLEAGNKSRQAIRLRRPFAWRMAASTPSRDSVDIAVLLAEKEDKVRAYIRSKDLMIDSLQSQLSNLQQDFVYNLDLANDYKRQLESADVQRESLQSALSDRDDRIARLSLLAQEKTSQLRNLHSARLDAERSAKDALRRHSAEMDQLLLRSTEEKESLAADFEARILELESTIKETDQKLSMQRCALLLPTHCNIQGHLGELDIAQRKDNSDAV